MRDVGKHNREQIQKLESGTLPGSKIGELIQTLRYNVSKRDMIFKIRTY